MTSLGGWLGFAGYRAGTLAIRATPHGASPAAARAAAAAVWRLGSRRVKYARVNLAIAMPGKSNDEREAIGRASLANFGLSIIELARSEGWTAADVREMHQVAGGEHLDKALSRGRGIIVLAPHMGNFELAVRALSANGYKVTAVARKARNQRVDDWIRRQREEGGAEVIAHRGSAVHILKSLRQGRLVPLLNDQYERRAHGVWAPLFGVRASTSPGAAILSQRSGAPVVPMHGIRIGPDQHRIVISEAIDPPRREADNRSAIVAATARYNRALEAAILEHPTQWVWSHRRFRHSPDLAENPYG